MDRLKKIETISVTGILNDWHVYIDRHLSSMEQPDSKSILELWLFDDENHNSHFMKKSITSNNLRR
jgi:hypothetical protein